MSREEAIEILKAHHMWTGEPQEIIDVRKENKALDMAIQALSQEPCEWGRMTFDATTGTSVFEFSDGTIKQVKQAELEQCEDAISRKKAIYVISARDGKSAQIEALEQLPSVTQKSVVESQESEE